MSVKHFLAVLVGILFSFAAWANKNKAVEVDKVNRIVLGAGIGPTGLKLSKDAKYVTERLGFVGGIYYQRKVKLDFVVGMGVESNRTVTLQFGKDF